MCCTGTGVSHILTLVNVLYYTILYAWRCREVITLKMTTQDTWRKKITRDRGCLEMCSFNQCTSTPCWLNQGSCTDNRYKWTLSGWHLHILSYRSQFHSGLICCFAACDVICARLKTSHVKSFFTHHRGHSLTRLLVNWEAGMQFEIHSQFKLLYYSGISLFVLTVWCLRARCF